MDNSPFIRVTVLGPPGSGKTSFINCFVNNAAPTESRPTLFPELYYRLVKMTPEADPNGKITPVLVEIEDTVARNLVHDEEEESKNQNETNMQCVQYYFDLSRNAIKVPQDKTQIIPFSIWNQPQVTVFPERPIYKPLTHARMSMLILFDANDRSSLDDACRIHSMYVGSMDLQKVSLRPYVCFVANKIDKDPLSEEYKLVMDLAEQYTQRAYVRLMKVSSFSSKNVRRTFLDLLYVVIGNQILWEIK